MELNLRWTDGGSPPQRARCPGCFSEKDLALICRHCGFDESKGNPAGALAPLSELKQGQYKIGKALGQTPGLGLSYLALNVQQERRVVIEEFLPPRLAARDSARSVVVPLSGAEADAFRFGMERFLHEARILVRLNHPCLLPMRDFFSENGTAYRVTDYVGGDSLEQLLQWRGGRISQRDALEGVRQILDGLERVHAAGALHRDIRPDHVRMVRGPETKGKTQRHPLLFGFAAARQALAEKCGTLEASLAAGFAAPELYEPDLRKGAWTDIYSCAALLYRMTAGVNPPPAPDRLKGRRDSVDPLQPLASLSGSVTREFEEAVLAGLDLSAQDRPQSVQEFRRLLGVEGDAASGKSSQPVAPVSSHGAVRANEQRPGPRPPLPSADGHSVGESRRPSWLAPLAIVAFLVVAAALFIWISPFGQSRGAASSHQQPTPSSGSPALDAQTRARLAAELNEAVLAGRIEAVRTLLDQGADPDLRDNLQTPLLVKAAVRGQPEIVDLLLEAGADLDARDRNGMTALQAAIVIDSPRSVEIVLSRNPDQAQLTEARRLANQLGRASILQLLGGME